LDDRPSQAQCEPLLSRLNNLKRIVKKERLRRRRLARELREIRAALRAVQGRLLLDDLNQEQPQ